MSHSKNGERIDFEVDIPYILDGNGACIPKPPTVIFRQHKPEPDVIRLDVIDPLMPTGKELFRKIWKGGLPEVVTEDEISSIIAVACANFEHTDLSNIEKGLYGSILKVKWDGIYLTNDEEANLTFCMVAQNFAGTSDWFCDIAVIDENSNKTINRIKGAAKTDDIIQQNWVKRWAQYVINRAKETEQ